MCRPPTWLPNEYLQWNPRLDGGSHLASEVSALLLQGLGMRRRSSESTRIPSSIQARVNPLPFIHHPLGEPCSPGALGLTWLGAVPGPESWGDGARGLRLKQGLKGAQIQRGWTDRQTDQEPTRQSRTHLASGVSRPLQSLRRDPRVRDPGAPPPGLPPQLPRPPLYLVQSHLELQDL